MTLMSLTLIADQFTVPHDASGSNVPGHGRGTRSDMTTTWILILVLAIVVIGVVELIDS